MSNATWICFDCRRVVRRPTTPRSAVVCPECRGACACLGRKIPVPPRDKVAAWTKLRRELQSLGISWAVRRAKATVARRHEIERRLVELERRPSSPGLDGEVKRLRAELDRS